MSLLTMYALVTGAGSNAAAALAACYKRCAGAAVFHAMCATLCFVALILEAGAA